MLERIWDIVTDLLFGYIMFLFAAAFIKILLRIYYPIEKRRYIVFEYSEEFSSIYREPTFYAKHGYFFKSQAQVKAEELQKKGMNVLAARNLEKVLQEQKEKESNGLDSKYTCA